MHFLSPNKWLWKWKWVKNIILLCKSPFSEVLSGNIMYARKSVCYKNSEARHLDSLPKQCKIYPSSSFLLLVKNMVPILTF